MDLVVTPQLSAPERGALRALVSRVEDASGHPALSEGMAVELSDPGSAPGHLRASVLAYDADGSLVGSAHLSGGPAAWSLELVRAPEWLERTDDTGTAALLRDALAEARRAGGGIVHLIAPKPDGALSGVIEAAGFALERRLLQLARRLPLEPPNDVARVVTRPFQVGSDERAFLAVNNRAFAGHPEQGGWDRATLDAREQLEWFDPDGFLLHEIDGRLVAFCWTKVHPAHAPGSGGAGEIYVIGVDPDFQGRGLGHGLTVAGAAHLAGRGRARIVLYVDDTNRAGVHLYESLGFVTDHEDLAFAKVVAPA